MAQTQCSCLKGREMMPGLMRLIRRMIQLHPIQIDFQLQQAKRRYWRKCEWRWSRKQDSLHRCQEPRKRCQVWAWGAIWTLLNPKFNGPSSIFNTNSGINSRIAHRLILKLKVERCFMENHWTTKRRFGADPVMA